MLDYTRHLGAFVYPPPRQPYSSTIPNCRMKHSPVSTCFCLQGCYIALSCPQYQVAPLHQVCRLLSTGRQPYSLGRMVFPELWSSVTDDCILICCSETSGCSRQGLYPNISTKYAPSVDRPSKPYKPYFSWSVEKSLCKLDQTSVAPYGPISQRSHLSSTSAPTAERSSLKFLRGCPSSKCSSYSTCPNAFSLSSMTQRSAGMTQGTWRIANERSVASVPLASSLHFSANSVSTSWTSPNSNMW